jgi:hypothetical protein
MNTQHSDILYPDIIWQIELPVALYQPMNNVSIQVLIDLMINMYMYINKLCNKTQFQSFHIKMLQIKFARLLRGLFNKYAEKYRYFLIFQVS